LWKHPSQSMILCSLYFYVILKLCLGAFLWVKFLFKLCLSLFYSIQNYFESYQPCYLVYFLDCSGYMNWIKDVMICITLIRLKEFFKSFDSIYLSHLPMYLGCLIRINVLWIISISIFELMIWLKLLSMEVWIDSIFI